MFLSERLFRPSTSMDFEDDDRAMYSTSDADDVGMNEPEPTPRYVRPRPARYRVVRNRPTARMVMDDDDDSYERPIYRHRERTARLSRRDEGLPIAFSTSSATRGMAVSVAHTDGIKAYSTAFSSPRSLRQSDDYVDERNH